MYTKNNIIIGIAGLVLITAAIWTAKTRPAPVAQNPLPQTQNETGVLTYKNAEEGYSFEYEAGPEGYMLVEENIPASEEKAPEHILVLFNAREYEEFLTSEAPREGPMAISISTYANPEKISARDWIKTEPKLSLSELALSPVSNFSLAGKEAVRYTADGLYPTDVVVVSSGEKIHVIFGSYNSREDEIYQDFETLLASFKFI